MESRRVLLDTDIGTDVDDLLALVLALKSPELSLEGVTTVGIEADRRARLAQKVLKVLGREDVPVMAGFSRPLLRRGEEVWGAYDGHGIDVSDVTPKAFTSALKAIEFLLSKASESPGKVTLITLGPLTNVAIAFMAEPRLKGLLKECFIMGGVFQRGLEGSTPREYNVSSDPEASNIVFSSGIPMTIVGLDVTLRVPLSRERLEKIKASGSPGAQLVFKAARDYQDRVARHPWNYLHDPLTVGVAVEKGFVRTRRMRVLVETRGSLTEGWVVAESRPPEDWEAPQVAFEVNAEGFLDFFVERVSSP